LAAQGKDAAAVKHLRLALSHKPNKIQYLCFLGLVSIREGNMHQAERAVNRSLRQNPSLPLTRITYVRLLFSQKQWDKGIKSLSQYLLDRPEDPVAHFMLAEYYIKNHRTDHALSLMRTFFQSIPQKRLCGILTMIKDPRNLEHLLTDWECVFPALMNDHQIPWPLCKEKKQKKGEADKTSASPSCSTAKLTQSRGLY
jgi:Tfp pilus assembly protein PilF